LSIKDTTQQQREREEEETKKRKREIETGIVKKISYLDMTRRRSSRTPSPPRGDRKMPPGFIPYDGIKEEEIEALKLVFRLDGSNPYKDDPYNVKRFMPNNIKGFMPYKDDPYSIKGFMPMTRYYESDFRAYLTTLHDDNMEVEDKYVAIQNLIKQMFHTQHAWIPPTWASGSRYMYNKPLHTFLHQSEPPSATRRRTGIRTYSIESPPKMKLSDAVVLQPPDKMPMSTPRDGREMPPGFIPYDGIKEAEIEALKVVFRLDGSKPFKDDPYDITRLYDESNYHINLATLHDDNMDVEKKYVAIQDLIKQMFHAQHAWIPPTWTSGSRYRYSKSLHTYLHQSEPPSATRRRTGILLQPLEQEQHSNNIDLLSFCILWSPLHPITSFLPFIGHMGISDSIGQPHDAEGCFDARGHFNPLIQYIPRIQYSSMEFGHLVRYLKVDIAVDINGQSEEWDEAIDRFDGIGGHGHVARILNRIGYKGRYDWGTMELLFLMFFEGSFTVDSNDTYTSSILSQFGPFLVIILLLVIVIIFYKYFHH
jgi:hypothetical protein